ncbi:hypothetical protein ACFQJC_09210 [Haloferax namakaokahaiae]|uniref:Restriction endonuclease n=1 Tax=Haloferax namakaokahaiae TaxID=1748331 RepID=A0ABD5ZEH6_9EURY
MSDVSLENVVSFLEIDDLTTVVERLYRARGERTKRAERDGKMFLFAAPSDADAPREVVWVDVTADFSEHAASAFAERCEDRGVDGTIITTGDEEDARETLAYAFATDEQLSELGEDDDPETFEPELLVPVEEVEVPLELVGISDLVEELEANEMGEQIIDEYHEPFEPEFEDVLREVDEEEAAAQAAEATAESSSTGFALAAVALLVVVVVVLFLFVF